MAVHVTSLADRLVAVEWGGPFRHTWSRVALMREYLRRAALWADAVDSTEWPFFDIAAGLDFAVGADDDAMLRAERDLDAKSVGGLVRRMAMAALHFAALRDTGTSLPDLPDPYEPLILMFERGGGFTLDGTGFIQVDMAGIPRGKREAHMSPEPRVSLDSAALDALD